MRDRQPSVPLAPDLTAPIIGYREWVLVGDELLSPLARTPWDGEPMRAECLARCRRAAGLWRRALPHPGPAPDPACVCGIYALVAPYPPRTPGRVAVIRGAVALWGRIEVHERGMRAEVAQMVTLAVPSASRRVEAALREVADGLGVETVGPKHLAAAALAHGRPLPPALVPS